MKKLFSFLTILFLVPQVCFGAASSSFDNSSSSVNMGNVLDVSTGDISGCGWLKQTEDASTDMLLSKKNVFGIAAGSGPGYTLKTNSSNDLLRPQVGDNTTGLNAGDGTSADPDGAWYYSCFRWDATGDTSNVMYAYQNGAQVNSETGTAIGTLSNAVSFYIGRDASGSAAAWTNGVQANAIVWLQLISVINLIESMWLPERAGITPDGLWMLWGDTTVIDLSPNNYDGTPANLTNSSDGPPIGFGGFLPL